MTLTAEEAARKPPNFLVDDLPQRIAKKAGRVPSQGPACRARRPDQGSEPALARRSQGGGPRRAHARHSPLPTPWRRRKTLLFLPNRLTDGIELSDDRLPVIRSEVYVLAFARRARLIARRDQRVMQSHKSFCLPGPPFGRCAAAVSIAGWLTGVERVRRPSVDRSTRRPRISREHHLDQGRHALRREFRFRRDHSYQARCREGRALDQARRFRQSIDLRRTRGRTIEYLVGVLERYVGAWRRQLRVRRPAVP